MRDERPLDAIGGIDLGHALVVAIVVFQQAAIDFAQARTGQCLAFFDFFVDRELEFAKHRLAEERRPDGLQSFAEIVELFLFALGVRHHVVVQQHLIADRRRFRREGRIVRLLVRLVRGGQQRMDGMSPFVDQGRHRVVVVVVVQEQIGMHVIGRAVHVCAGGFARARQHVHPA